MPDAFGRNHAALLGNVTYEAVVESIAHRAPSHAPAWMESACLLPTVRVWNLDEKFKNKPTKQGQYVDKQELKGLLGCLYVVRCNLYHGGKAAGNELDLSLCESGYQVLSALLLRYTWR